MKKRIFSFILALVLILGLLPTVTFAAPFEGSGTINDPYLISDKTQLNNVRNYLDSYFKLMCDIEFTDADFEEGGDFYNGGQGFVPIGSSGSSAFVGNFNGNGFAIKNLYINISSSNSYVYAGLFGYNKGTIKNLGMVDGDVSASSSYSASADACAGGGIAGCNGGTITNCYNTGAVSATSYDDYAHAGGIAGNNGGIITNCYNTGDVSSSDFVGGIAGNNSYARIENCYNTGNMSASSYSAFNTVYAGGISGRNNYGTIKNCYNTGNVSALSTLTYSSVNVGGIAGDNSGRITNCYNTGNMSASTASSHSYALTGAITGENSGTLTNCYNIGAVSAESTTSADAYAGGITSVNNGTLTNCYYLNTISKGVDKGTDTTTKCTAEELQLQSSYIGFDFENVWTMGGDKCYLFAELKNLTTESDHRFSDACDTTCDCGFEREAPHDYNAIFDKDNHFDKCTLCGDVINSKPHEYENACDTDCDCGATRTISHSFSEYVYDNNATESADGTKTRVCSVCEHKETIIAEGTKLEKTLIDSSKMFEDIPTKKWFKEYVDYSVSYGIFTGTSKTEFSPSMNISRAQFVQVLANLSGVDTSNRNVTTEFIDVPTKKWFTPAVKWASENGIVNGMGGGKFEPNANVTREQMCVMLTNYAKFENITLKSVEAKESFADDGKISKWAKTAVYTCQQADIVNGKGAGKFDPKGTGTRAEASVMFTKFHKDYMA